MGCIIEWSGVGTLEDFRRFRDYDADKTVDRYLNKPAVKASLAPARTHSIALIRPAQHMIIWCSFQLGMLGLAFCTRTCETLGQCSKCL